VEFEMGFKGEESYIERIETRERKEKLQRDEKARGDC